MKNTIHTALLPDYPHFLKLKSVSAQNSQALAADSLVYRISDQLCESCMIVVKTMLRYLCR